MKYDHVVTITGVSGFVGSHLARALLNHDRYKIRVFGADVGPSSRLDDLMDREGFDFFDYNVHQPLRSDLLAVDTLYHFAGIADPQRYLAEPITVMDLNLQGLENILKRTVLWSAHRPRIVYSSTSEVYARNEDVPFDEEESLMVFGQGRRWCYALSKAVGEQYLKAYGADHGFDYTIFRFFNFVGKDIDAPGSGRVITRMVGDALSTGTINVTGPGTQTRCFTYVDDFVVPLMSAATRKLDDERYRNWSGTLNLGSDEEVTMWTVAEHIADALVAGGHAVERPHIELVEPEKRYGAGYEDAQRRVPKTDRAAEVLGWRAQLKLADFLPDIVDAVVARYKLDREIPESERWAG